MKGSRVRFPNYTNPTGSGKSLRIWPGPPCSMRALYSGSGKIIAIRPDPTNCLHILATVMISMRPDRPTWCRSECRIRIRPGPNQTTLVWGPEHWPDEFPDCDGRRQSPVDMDVYDMKLERKVVIHLVKFIQSCRGSVVPSSQYCIRDIRHLLYIRSLLV